MQSEGTQAAAPAAPPSDGGGSSGTDAHAAGTSNGGGASGGSAAKGKVVAAGATAGSGSQRTQSSAKPQRRCGSCARQRRSSCATRAASRLRTRLLAARALQSCRRRTRASRTARKRAKTSAWLWLVRVWPDRDAAGVCYSQPQVAADAMWWLLDCWQMHAERGLASWRKISESAFAWVPIFAAPPMSVGKSNASVVKGNASDGVCQHIAPAERISSKRRPQTRIGGTDASTLYSAGMELTRVCCMHTGHVMTRRSMGKLALAGRAVTCQ